MKSNIRLSLFSLKATALLALLRKVVMYLTGNTNFPDLPFTTTVMTAQADKLDVAIAKADKGSALDRSKREDQVKLTRAMLTATADYVRYVAQGDRTILESSGFDLARQREPAPLPQAPAHVVAFTTGRNSEVELRWERVQHAHSYQVWMTDQDPLLHGSWDAIGITTKARRVVDGLEPYKAYWFSITALGSAGHSALSEPVPARAA